MRTRMPHTLPSQPASRVHPVSHFAARFTRGYWTFYFVAFCMDLGFGLFIFLFNLYLTDLHFDERVIGRILACFTLGNVAGTIPAMILVRRIGLRPLLIITFLFVPIVSVLRVFVLLEPAQFFLAFLTGAALCGWPICFSPTIAELTSKENRSLGFSLAFSTGIGLGTLSGIAGGYIPEILHTSALHLDLVGGIRVVLILACAIVACGLVPLLRLSLKSHPLRPGARKRVFHPFLLRFLPAFVLWNIVTGSFPLFGAVYLQKVLGIPLGRLGAVFAASQLTQFAAVLCAPLLMKRFGIARGVAQAQLATGLLLLLIATAGSVPVAVCFYLLYFAAQFMSGPGIYQMLMERIPEEERSTASALQNLSGALCQSATAAVTGVCIVTYGYRTLLIGDAGFAVVASILFVLLGTRTHEAEEGQIPNDSTAISKCAMSHVPDLTDAKAAE